MTSVSNHNQSCIELLSVELSEVELGLGFDNYCSTDVTGMCVQKIIRVLIMVDLIYWYTCTPICPMDHGGISA